MPQRKSAGGRPGRAGAAASGRGEHVDELAREMATAGLATRIRQVGARTMTAGVTARVPFRRLLGTNGGPGRDLSLVYAALRAGIPVTVTIIDPDGAAASDELATFRLRFCEFLDTAAVDRGLLGLCLSAAELPSPEFRADIRPSLGEGPRYVMLHANRAPAARPREVWRLLQASEARGPRFWPAFPAGVRSRCPLLSAESTDGLLPGVGLAAPSGSAWLPMELDVCRHADTNGNLSLRRLDRALDAAVGCGDRLIDALCWFDDRQRQDARLNRRLAVVVCGLGDLVRRRGADPASFSCLREVDQLVAAIHDGLWQRSRRLADADGPLPALADRQPSAAWRDESHRRDWLARWRIAVSNVQVRNRNLLALSPYSLLPRGRAASPDYADLLPVLAHADVLAFACPPSLTHWKAREFKGFHRRVEALVERRNAASFVAAGV